MSHVLVVFIALIVSRMLPRSHGIRSLAWPGTCTLDAPRPLWRHNNHVRPQRCPGLNVDRAPVGDQMCDAAVTGEALYHSRAVLRANAL